MDSHPEHWQEIVRRALPPDPGHETFFGLKLEVQAADGTPHTLHGKDMVAVEHTEAPEATEGHPVAILVSLDIGFDIYHPPPADAPPVLVEQARRNRPRLERFLTAIRDDLNGTFYYRDAPEVGPLGILEPGASQDGLPRY